MATTFDINQCPPFKDPMETLGIQAYDVIKIKNVPFGVTIPEIRSFVGRLTSSPLLRDHQQGYPIHIIMERPTGKTMDCFVEFQFDGGAKAAVSRAEQILFDGRSLKIGARHVDVEMSNEGELCAALFPRAKSVRWDSKTGIPIVLVNQDPYSEGFQGFFTVEEMNSISKQASTPQKSTFSQRCQQRVYESMISTLYKFPWHVPEHYSVSARNFLWTVYMDLLHNLVARVQPNNNSSLYGSFDKEVGLNHTLLMEYLFAGLNVQMFSLRQKLMIVHAAGPVGVGFGLPQQAVNWPFHSLIPSYTYSSDIVTEWLNVLETGFHKAVTYGIQHGYENYLRLGRDEAGRMKFELNELGRGLKFKDLISMELGLMEFLIEEGRIELCLQYRIPYQPLNLRTRPHSSPSTEIDAAMQHLALVPINEDKPAHPGDAELNAFGPSIPHSPNSQRISEHEAFDVSKTGEHQASGQNFSAKPTGRTQFNPDTPPFVPSQPWYGTSGINVESKASSMHFLEQPQGSTQVRPHAQALPWAPPKFHVNNTSFATEVHAPHQAPPPGSEIGSVGDSAPYDPFSIPPRGPRRTSLKSDRRAITGQIVSNTGLKEGDGSTYSKGAAVAGWALPPRPIFNNIWGPPNVAPVAHTTQRRSVSEGSGSIGGSPDRTSRSSSASISQFKTNFNYAEPLQTMKHTPPSFQSAIAFEPDLACQTPDKRSWPWGSPVRGSLSRNSTGRNNLRIDATIDEEGDAVDDVATDASGVSL